MRHFFSFMGSVPNCTLKVYSEGRAILSFWNASGNNEFVDTIFGAVPLKVADAYDLRFIKISHLTFIEDLLASPNEN